MEILKKENIYFDASCVAEEQFPRQFSISFQEVGNAERSKVRVLFNDQIQVGDVINDNANQNDFYRYHDIFHYSFATLLGWSPCARAMIKRKRKSQPVVDEVEDGARATITEEAISMIIFNKAKRKEYFTNKTKVSKTTLRIIKELTENFEVRTCSTEQWEAAILHSYKIFRLLIENSGGRVEFNLETREMHFSRINYVL